jgi:hypothetical protein
LRDVGPDRSNTNNTDAVIDISPFSYPAAFIAGRNIVTGLPLVWSSCLPPAESGGFRQQITW